MKNNLIGKTCQIESRIFHVHINVLQIKTGHYVDKIYAFYRYSELIVDKVCLYHNIICAFCFIFLGLHDVRFALFNSALQAMVHILTICKLENT